MCDLSPHIRLKWGGGGKECKGKDGDDKDDDDNDSDELENIE